ncbi:MAG: pyruvate, phosphate dikinase [Bacteroidia bacterium]|nr:pyruvate, phosphate dikinase [Bacteroidia bacterium]
MEEVMIKPKNKIVKDIYLFGEGNREMKALLGGKGANLQEMHNLGIPVPPFFTISTTKCKEYYSVKDSDLFMQKLIDNSKNYMGKMGEELEREFGSETNPLLVSVRSGAVVSMPGMMDTILNIGLTDHNLDALKRMYYKQKSKTMDELYDKQKKVADRFGLDAYRRLLQMFASTISDEESKGQIDKGFRIAMKEVKDAMIERFGKLPVGKKEISDNDMSIADLELLIEKYKKVYYDNGLEDVMNKCFENTNTEEAVYEQLRLSVEAVFSSSRSPRAIVYKEKEGLPADLGTAVNVQAMVFGNTGNNSSTGVLFTRNNATGAKTNRLTDERMLYGDWLLNAQGEDVVAGIRNTHAIPSLEKAMPVVYKDLKDIVLRLESHFKDMQDVEFTVENCKLWILQTRNGKRSSLAKLVTSVDMVEEGLITEKEAVQRFSPDDLEILMHPVFDPKANKTKLSQGLNAGYGEVSGVIALSPEYAQELALEGKDVILVREDTSPEDVHGMLVSRGVYTKTGGLTSHAAIVGKQFNKAVVVGDANLVITEGATRGHGSVSINGKVFQEGNQYISISGTTGNVYEGRVPSRESEIERVVKGEMKSDNSLVFKYLVKMLRFAKKVKKIGVRANADTAIDAKVARMFGAEGIGLLRTEHTMFEDTPQINAMREMILAQDKQSRILALKEVEALQLANFIGVFRVMDGLPITIRLLDPPLDEFLPNSLERQEEFVNYMYDKYHGDKSAYHKAVKEKIEDLRESNPMMGFRGNRLCVIYPEIAEMQARSIFEAICVLRKEGLSPVVEIMFPVVISSGEIIFTMDIMERIKEEVVAKHRSDGIENIDVHYGTMMETPRAALNAEEIAKNVDFFSFGTNDLTQLTNGMDRNSSAAYLDTYIDNGFIKKQPFLSIDEKGPGKLVEIAVKEGKKANPDIKLGFCGEHGGDPLSIEFFSRIGLHYVSCGAFKVPVAILSAGRLVD